MPITPPRHRPGFLLHLLCALLLTLPAMAAAGSFGLNLPLLLNDAYLGDLHVEVDTDYNARVDAPRLVALLERHIEPQLLRPLRQRAAAEPLQPPTALSTEAIAIDFDPSTLEVHARTPSDALTRHQRRLSGGGEPRPQDFPRPDRFALGVDLSHAEGYVHASDLRERGRLPSATALDARLNLGGFGGVNLVGGAIRDGERDDRWRRQDALAFYDHYPSATRFAAGDITPLAAGFQGAPRLAGVGISRLYGEIRPFRNIRPVGRRQLVLEEAALVDVEVNGVITHRLQLPAGPYDLTDFPFASGGNDVRLIVEDAAGRREVQRFSLFYDPVVLGRGVSLFSFNVGLLEQADTDGIRYGSTAAASGFIEYGLTDNLTVGLNAQGSEAQWMTGASATGAGVLGAVRGQIATSRDEDDQEGYAGGIAYSRSFGGGRLSLMLDSEGYDAAFRSLQTTTLRAGELRLSHLGRLQLALPGGYGAALGGQYQEFRGDRGSYERQDLTLSRAFLGAMNVFVNLHRTYQDEEEEFGAFLGVSVRLGDRHSARLRADSRNDRVGIEAQRHGYQRVGDVSGRIGASRSDQAEEAEARLRYLGNRIDLEGQTVANRQRLDGAEDYQSRLQLRTAIGVTAGGIAWGRQTRNGFAIVRPHPTLGSRELVVQQSLGGQPLARSDRFGPLLLPLSRPYVPERLPLAVADLPLGYDLGSGLLETFPGAFSGYSVTVGSDHSLTLLGVLLDRDGEPRALLSGQLLPEAGGEPIAFFTNRGGRFVAERVAIGRYSLVVDGRDSGRTIEIETDAEGLIDVGKISLD